MDKNPIIIVGTSGQAGVIRDIISQANHFSSLGFLDSTADIGSVVQGLPVLGRPEQLFDVVSNFGCKTFALAIGDNFTRHKVVEMMCSQYEDLVFPVLIHPAASISASATLKRGTTIMPGAVVCSGASIGEFGLVNTLASVDHDNDLGDFVSLAPHASTGGDVCIGNFSSLCISATVSHGLKIGQHSIVGACSFVNVNIPDNSVFYGVPARFVRKRKPGDPYLGGVDF